MKLKYAYQLKMLFVVCFVLTGCQAEHFSHIGKNPSFYTDVGVLERYTHEGEYIGKVDEGVFEIKVDDKIIKLETDIEHQEILKRFNEGDHVTITYTGPPNTKYEYLLEDVIVH